MKIRFGELNNGDEFEFAGKTLTKLDNFNAVTKVSRGKQNFMFFRHNLVTVNNPPPTTETNHTTDLGMFYCPYIPILKTTYVTANDSPTDTILDTKPWWVPAGLNRDVHSVKTSVISETKRILLSMDPVPDEKYSNRVYQLSMQADNCPPVNLLMMDKSDVGQWTIALLPFSIDGVVVDGMYIEQNDGYTSLTKNGVVLTQMRVSAQDWMNGNTVTIVFNN